MIVEKQKTTADKLYTLKIKFDDAYESHLDVLGEFGLYDSNDDLVILSSPELEIYRLEAKEFRNE
jgi:hypothetical protein